LGEVVIEVVRATGLKAPSIGEWRLMIGQKPSPFVKLALRGHEQSTKKEEKTLFPVWNERLVWRGKRGELCKPKMLVDVMAWDPLTPASMGRAEVDLAPLLVDDTCDLMVLLQTQGQLQLRCTWVAREQGKVILSLESASGLPAPLGKSKAVAPSG
jgi:Ca2+-dependent lipid-binding protein